MTDITNFGTNKRIHLLIVSGNSTLRKRLEEGLKVLNYHVYSSSDGEMALSMLKQRRIDAAVTSLELLGMNGIQLSRAIARIHPNVPVIVMSSRPEPGQVAQALSSGASDLVSESLTPDELHVVVMCNIERKASPTRRIAADRAETLFRVIRMLTAAIDAKSHYAAKHSSHVTQLSLIVGQKLCLSNDQMATLELAAQLHDIGKIGTPDTVLTKPDVLTDEEWVDVLKHPALGSAFLANVPELCEVAAIIRHHHEHFDGTGYPDGLQGDAIPYFSRIIAIADAYDAMTSERPYRKARSHQEAIDELVRNSGKQFDASLVQCFIAAQKEGLEERRAA